jgi:tetraprenyl-beta-curcumene synthase
MRLTVEPVALTRADPVAPAALRPAGRRPHSTRRARLRLRGPRAEDALLAGAFAGGASRYVVTIFPLVARELAHWQARATRISDPFLRRLAADALGKRGNMEGAGLFAVLAPRAARDAAVRALVAFQAAYNYLDTLVEQPSRDPVQNGRQLHHALLVALEPGAAHSDYYAHCPHWEDGGYLAEMVDACRHALGALPSYELAAQCAQTAAARIVAFQSLNLGERQGGQAGPERWARLQTPLGSGLCWWETAAAGGSSLGVHALIASAGRPDLDPGEVAAMECAYFPWIGALHSLLDSLVDVAEDSRDGQRNLLGYYRSTGEISVRLMSIAASASSASRTLAGGRRHEVVLTAMAGYYLSAPEASSRELCRVSTNVAIATGALVKPALPLFRASRMAAGLARGACRPRG